MGLIAKIKGMVEYKRYLKTLTLSTALALLTLYIAFGLMFFTMKGNPRYEDLPDQAAELWDLMRPFILLIFAIFFIIFTVFYESRGKGKSKGKESVKSLIKGLFLGTCATFAFVTVMGGMHLIVHLMLYGFDLIGGFESFISALAICMIVSMVFLSLLKPSEVKEKI
jgi:hypothetical protein